MAVTEWTAWYADPAPTTACSTFHHQSERKAEYDARVWRQDMPDDGPYAIYEFNGQTYEQRKVIA